MKVLCKQVLKNLSNESLLSGILNSSNQTSRETQDVGEKSDKYGNNILGGIMGREGGVLQRRN